jgi:hypothetical protein
VVFVALALLAGTLAAQRPFALPTLAVAALRAAAARRVPFIKRASALVALCVGILDAFRQIPATRALAIAGSDAPVFRETPETAAVLTRVAPTHMRFGTFEYFHSTQDHDAVSTLATYAIDRWNLA